MDPARGVPNPIVRPGYAEDDRGLPVVTGLADGRWTSSSDAVIIRPDLSLLYMLFLYMQRYVFLHACVIDT